MKQHGRSRAGHLPYVIALALILTFFGWQAAAHASEPTWLNSRLTPVQPPDPLMGKVIVDLPPDQLARDASGLQCDVEVAAAFSLHRLTQDEIWAEFIVSAPLGGGASETLLVVGTWLPTDGSTMDMPRLIGNNVLEFTLPNRKGTVTLYGETPQQARLDKKGHQRLNLDVKHQGFAPIHLQTHFLVEERK